MQSVKPSANGVNRIAAAIKTVAIPNHQIGEVKIELVGQSSLIVHKFSAKSAREMAEKQSGNKASTARQKRNPESDYFESMYIIKGDPRKDKPGKPSSKCKAIHGIPVSGFKKLMARASKDSGSKMIDTMTRFFIFGDHGSDLVSLKFSKVEMRTDIIRVANGNPDLRYRPEYFDWSCVLHCKYNAAVMPIAQLISLLRSGGLFVGWGELRPEKGFDHGRFSVGNVQDLGIHAE